MFGSGLKSLTAQANAQNRTNCFFEIVNDSDKAELMLRSTPGLTILCTLPTFPIRGWLQKGNYLYVASGNGLYQVSQTGGYCLLGNFGAQTNTSPVILCTNEEQLMLVDGYNGYVLAYGDVVDLTLELVSTYITDCALLGSITAATGNPV